MKKTKRDVNVNITTIEKSMVSLITNVRIEKMKRLQDAETLTQVKDYIFGRTDENPLEDINEAYIKNVELIRNKISKTAQIEKQNYMGKSKRGVNFVKKLKIEED
jgi:hypothetical protein